MESSIIYNIDKTCSNPNKIIKNKEPKQKKNKESKEKCSEFEKSVKYFIENLAS